MWSRFFVAGGPLVLAPDRMFVTLGMVAPDDWVFPRLAGLLVVCFGGVYLFVAHDPPRYRPLVWLGVAGKGGVVVLFTLAWLGGHVPFAAFALSFGDLAFGLGFLAFLLRNRPAPQHAKCAPPREDPA